MMRLPATLLLMFFYCSTLAQPASRYDVLITEIMADPDPVVLLPNAEYIELKNRSNKPVNLQGWRITTATSRSGALPNFLLQPDSFVIVTTASQQAALAPFGTTISVPSFPALVNTGTTLTLLSAENKVIHAIAYTDDWYGDKTKAKGGYSLEMIDATNPCTGAANWGASKNGRGGTPGKTNSIAGDNKDETPPALLNALVINDTTLVINFSEPLDSSKAVAFANYRLQPDIEITGVKALNPLLNSVELKLATAIDSSLVYTLTVVQVADCSGNLLGIRNKVPIGQPQPAQAGDLIINEILFNPRPAGSDYIELYNRSQKVIDLSQLQLANRAASGQLASLRKTFENPFYLFPGEYLVLTEDALILPKQYFVPNIDAVLQVAALPSMPDAEGSVVLLNNQLTIIDEVSYHKDWHHPLIADAEGVSLERIDMNAPAQQKSNWHSAASDVGYGTPGYKNSQYQPGLSNVFINIRPKTFSPDGDGYDDVTTIEYSIAESGFVANVYIYDAGGRQVRHLVKNGLAAPQGQWQWNGKNDNNQMLPVGTYVIVVEMFDAKGKKLFFKNPMVLARRI
jgi:hypothetical protein